MPRWYAEGSAVFFETWMAGGLGRAQGGYDEMVFRAKVRDNDKLYSPLGLESEGIVVDFQIGVNDYLYGTRFFSWLALTYGPEKVMQWLRRDEGSEAFYATQFRRVFGKKLDDAWSDWHAWEREFQQGNLARLSRLSTDRGAASQPARASAPCRAAMSTSGPTSWSPPSAIPGEIGFIGTMDLATGKLRKLPRSRA